MELALGQSRHAVLAPDVVDHMEALAEQGAKQLVVCPVGFISDHMEVVWDLDTELVAAAKEKGVEIYRTRTAGGPSDAFSSMVVDLIEELCADRQPEGGLGTVTVQGCTVNGAPCAEGCCDIWSLHKPH